MEIGVAQRPVDPWPETVERAGQLEAMGFDHLWLYDHLSWRHYRDHPWHATMPWLTGLAATTSTIRLGTMVASATLRHPLMLAKEAMSLDHVSNGRLILGVGAGGTGWDATVYGDRPLSPGERAGRLDEYVRVLDGLLRGELTDHQGPWYTVDGGRMLPGCVQRPRVPLAVASGGPRTTALAAELADTWITVGDTTNRAVTLDDFVDAVTEQSRWLDEGCARAERDPADVERLAFISSTFPAPMASLDAFVQLAEALEAIGFGAVVIHDHRSDDPDLDFGAELVEAIADWHLARQRR